MVKGCVVYILIKCDENNFYDKIYKEGFPKNICTERSGKWLKDRSRGKFSKELSVDIQLIRYGRTQTDWVEV